MLKVRGLRAKSGCGLQECNNALNIFDNDIDQAYEYLKMKGIAVCRRKADGTQWTNQDYIDCIKKEVGSDEKG